MRALRRSGRRFRVHRIDGLEMAVDVTDGTARLLHFYGQSCEPGLTRALRQRLAPGDVFLDIGATIGFFPVLAGLTGGADGTCRRVRAASRGARRSCARPAPAARPIASSARRDTRSGRSTRTARHSATIVMSGALPIL